MTFEEKLYHSCLSGYPEKNYSIQQQYDSCLRWLEKEGNHVIFLSDEHYPFLLAQIPDPPQRLFFQGRLPRNDELLISAVGTRTAHTIPLAAAYHLGVWTATSYYGVVSGLARGIDQAVFEGVKRADGVAFGVLGCGLNNPYPNCSNLKQYVKERGGLLSEYFPDAEPEAWHFPVRNRIISGLSMLTIIIEAQVQSGAMHTAHYALTQGRDVAVHTAGIFSSGCRALVQDGARVLTSLKGLNRGILLP